VSLTNADYLLEAPGVTFAGRDVLAPVAAHLCNGIDLMELGEEVDADLLFPGVVPLPQIDDATVIAQALWTDRFGNVQLNVGAEDLPDGFGDMVQIRCSAPSDATGGTSRVATRVRTFADLPTGAVGLVVDANGLLAVTMNQRSAAEEIGIDDGDQVVITELTDDPSVAPESVPVGLSTERPVR